jgi:hypothetical protein
MRMIQTLSRSHGTRNLRCACPAADREGSCASRRSIAAVIEGIERAPLTGRLDRRDPGRAGPAEIAQFVTATSHTRHQLDLDVAMAIYAANAPAAG